MDNITHGTQIILAGRVIRQSRNLRGMRDYAKTARVVKVETRKCDAHDRDPRGVMHVIYADGATSEATFNSHAIMIDWIRGRRSWRGAEIIHHDGDMGYLTKPGIIGGGT